MASNGGALLHMVRYLEAILGKHIESQEMKNKCKGFFLRISGMPITCPATREDSDSAKAF